MANNKLIIGDTEYEIDAAYRAGAKAMRDGRHFRDSNPYRYGSTNFWQFDYGHQNEADGIHVVEDEDVIAAPMCGRTFTHSSGVIPEKLAA